MEDAVENPSSPPLVSVLIISYNTLADLPGCLESVSKQTYPAIETIVVDNNSSDGSLSWLQEHTGITLIENESNLGFAAANNQAIRVARGQWVLLLNSDARLESACIERLIKRVKQDISIASASPKIYRADGRTLDSTGILLQRRRLCPIDRGEEEVDQRQYDAPEQEEIFGPSGAVALYRREALIDAAVALSDTGDSEEVGEIFDEDFFAYYEDVDLAWRLRLRGWNSVYVPMAISSHFRKGPGRKEGWLQRQAFANRYYCFIKVK